MRGERAATWATSPLRQAVLAGRRHYGAAAALSLANNLLYLTPTLYMLQVYDRVVPTSGLGTLAFLSACALAAYATQGVLDWVRARLLVKAGMRLDRVLAGPVLGTVLSRRTLSAAQRGEALRELDGFRQAIAGPVMTVAFDAPWTPIYVIAAFLLNPWLGLLTVVACIVLVIMAWRSERAVQGTLEAANDAAAHAYRRQQQMTTHAAQVRALGMRRALTARALGERAGVNDLQLRASFTGGSWSSWVKSIRLILQSAGLGIGALLAVEGKISSGAIIAVTLLLSRALSPIEQLTGNWKQVIRARTAFLHLDAILRTAGDATPTQLPRPSGAISLEDLTVATPGGDRVAIAGISAQIEPGEIIGVAGLSGAGKSTLIAAMAGALPLLRGAVRLDGASLEAWDAERLAGHVGYLPQDFVLFPGTVKENIARFAGETGADPAAIDAGVVAVAQAVGAHEMILRLPNGYDTQVGQGGAGLSAGQTQRVALARALYGDPAILLLDEPNASLDAEGNAALIALVRKLAAEGRTVVMAAHSPELLTQSTRVMLLSGGRLTNFGPLAKPGQVHRLGEKRA